MSEVPLYNLISSVRKSISAGGGREGRFIQGDEPVDYSRVAGLNILQHGVQGYLTCKKMHSPRTLP